MVVPMTAAGVDPDETDRKKKFALLLGSDTRKGYTDALQTSNLPPPVTSYRKRIFASRFSMTMRKVLLSVTSLTAIR